MTIAHKLVGHGPVKVIALHGWFGTSEGWGMLPELIDTDAYTYALIDYRGYGARRDEAGEFTLEEISADTLALADELGWDRFALIGHSMGGAAALRVLADAPDRVTAVIGVSPVPASGVPFDDDTAALFGGAENEDGNRYAILDFTTGNRQSATWLRQMTQFSVDFTTRPAFGAYLRSWAGADFAAELPLTSIPVKTIVGEHDPALGAETMKATWMTQLPQCELDVLANAGHYAMFEAPVAMITSIEAVLSELK
ncbi:alpha/beta fold hydrolase [Rhodococcus sp. AG1013]|uniref:alpha/beta fold hydrolase n=1 Tax=unclassified Rhodococcus (in: high G+C Gram-positive bacteria) TaxID=192944 RepID=UPI000E0C61F1|nr:alpha/beta hydrolase [Rhodococcus sp. AG1013]RDI19461.1 pimeloyl-ACP methyl ester carboxylesterase [Rhodococcus sp. AG1013]